MLNPTDRTRARQYVLCGVVLWFLVDFGTAGGFRLSYLTSHGLALAIFYVGYPLAFGYLIFRWRWDQRRLFMGTIAAILFIEGLLIGNPFVVSFPLMLVGLPLAICVYAPLTYFPLWIVNREVGQHKGVMLILSGVIIAISALTTLSAK